MSVNNSLITKQHDRPFISACRVVRAAIRVYGLCVCTCGHVCVCGRLQVRAEVLKRKLASEQVHTIVFCMHTEFRIASVLLLR